MAVHRDDRDGGGLFLMPTVKVVEYHTFTSDGTLPESFIHQGRFSQLTMGKVGADDLGGGDLLIQKETLDGGLHTIRTISEEDFATLQDRTLRLELPDESVVKISLENSTAPTFYVEHRNQKDDRV